MELLGKKVTTKEVIIGLFTAVVFAVLFFIMLGIFRKDLAKEPMINFDQNETNPNHVEVTIQITGIDPVKGDMQVRIIPDPKGDLSKDSITLDKDITIYTNSNSGKNEFAFSKGKRMNPFEISIELYEGFVMEYPYDKHKAELSVEVYSVDKDSSGKTVMTGIPLVKETNFLSSVNGYRVVSAAEDESEPGYSDIIISIERTAAVKMFSRFIMVLFWMISICVVLVIASIIVRNRKVEYSMFAFLSAMLFALPAVRNVQPFIPTIGCLSDYVSFFWAEGIVAAGLILMVLAWLKRPGQKHS